MHGHKSPSAICSLSATSNKHVLTKTEKRFRDLVSLLASPNEKARCYVKRKSMVKSPTKTGALHARAYSYVYAEAITLFFLVDTEG
jgi:hypothetical protein